MTGAKCPMEFVAYEGKCPGGISPIVCDRELSFWAVTGLLLPMGIYSQLISLTFWTKQLRISIDEILTYDESDEKPESKTDNKN